MYSLRAWAYAHAAAPTQIRIPPPSPRHHVAPARRAAHSDRVAAAHERCTVALVAPYGLLSGLDADGVPIFRHFNDLNLK